VDYAAIIADGVFWVVLIVAMSRQWRLLRLARRLLKEGRYEESLEILHSVDYARTVVLSVVAVAGFLFIVFALLVLE